MKKHPNVTKKNRSSMEPELEIDDEEYAELDAGKDYFWRVTPFGLEQEMVTGMN